jgi:ribonuclease VapC
MTERVLLEASALVAILALEPEHEHFSNAIEAAGEAYISPISVVEAVMVLSSSSGRSPSDVELGVKEFLRLQNVQLLTVRERTTSLAVNAFERYGKGRHPAKLNLGDCFSYACAKEHRLSLLYKGRDFAQTDLA